MPDISTCLWFDGQAEEAAQFYCALVPDSRITRVDRPAPDAAAVLVHFTLAGTPYWALNGGPGHPHTNAASIAVVLDSQEQADTLYDQLLAADGSEIMCGWITDRYGLPWQVIPPGLPDALFSGTAEQNQRAHDEMITQKKLNAAAIVAARDAN